MGHVTVVGGCRAKVPVAGILASSLAVGTTVKLMEGGTAVEYLVVNQGIPSNSDLYDASCDGTWLLRKDIHSNRQWNPSYVNKYESSAINTWLNGEFFNTLGSAEQAAIKQVKIPYRKNGGSGGTDESGVNGLPCKIFLLGGYEIGFTTSDNSSFPVDGAKLSYFESGTGTSANNKRIAKLNGSAANWWLRSPDTSGTRFVWRVSSDGDGYYGNAYEPLGVRPTLILPQDMEVDSSGNVTPPPPATHKTLINGTAYEVKGGKCLVNGVAYSIKKGRTLINGTGYDITFEEAIGKTWVLNETSIKSLTSEPTYYYANFTSNGEKFKAFNVDIMAGAVILSYLFLNQDVSHTQQNVYYYSWTNEAYRTVTFDEAPSGDLLAWLQANAVQQ